MPSLVLTKEQVEIVTQSLLPVEVLDSKGNVLGRVEPLSTAEEIADLEEYASNGPYFTSEQVQARLRALQRERVRTGGFDKDYARKFMEQLHAEDPGHMREVD